MGRLWALEAGLGFSACRKKLHFASLSNIGGEHQAYIRRFMVLPAWWSLPITLWGPPPSCSAEGSLFCLAFPVVPWPSGPQWMEQCFTLMGGHIWAGCHVEHRARSSQLGLVEAGSRSWLVVGVSLGVREG